MSSFSQDDASADEIPMGMDINDVSANCFLYSDDVKSKMQKDGFVDSHGMIFGFPTKMETMEKLPDDTLRQILAVLFVLETPNNANDILSDGSIKLDINRKGRVVSAWEHEKVDMDNSEMLMEYWSQAVDDRASQDVSFSSEIVKRYGGSVGKKSFKAGEMMVTIHAVRYNDKITGDPHFFFVSVLWVLCHKNFNFLQKAESLFGDPNVFRSQSAGFDKTHVNRVAQERMFQLWNDILLKLMNAVGSPVLIRMQTGTCTSDTHTCWSMGPDQPGSFLSMTNPLSVYDCIVRMCKGGTNVSVEGMDRGILNRHSITVAHYITRYKAYNRQYAHGKLEQAIAKELTLQASRQRKRKSRNGGEEDEPDNIENSAEALEASICAELEKRAVKYQVCPNDLVISIQRDEALVEAVLEGDRTGVYRSTFGPDLVGQMINQIFWPVSFDESNGLHSSVPDANIILGIELGTIRHHMLSIIRDADIDVFIRDFGPLPNRARLIIESQYFSSRHTGSSAEHIMSAFLRDPKMITESERRSLFKRDYDVLSSYMYDSKFKTSHDRYISMITAPGALTPAQRLEELVVYFEYSVYSLRSSLKSGGFHSQVLQSTELYLANLDSQLSEQMHAVVPQYLCNIDSAVGSFEYYFTGFLNIIEDCNNSYWKMMPWNLHLFVYFGLSELLWRMGTFGNWKWIGMTIQMVDGANLLHTVKMNKKRVVNSKKNGSSGTDYTLNTHKSDFRLGYKQIVDPEVLALCPDDQHAGVALRKTTPTAVIQGLIKRTGDKVHHPGNELGALMDMTEGWRNPEITENIVAYVPRDDTVNYVSSNVAIPGDDRVWVGTTETVVPGFGMTLRVFSMNQQPEDIERRSDLINVITSLPAQGASEASSSIDTRSGIDLSVGSFYGAMQGNRTYCTCRLYIDAYVFGGSVTGRGDIRDGVQSSMPQDVKAQMAWPFSVVQMVATEIALLQKTGYISFDVSAPVNFVIRRAGDIIHGHLSAIIAPEKKAHYTRALDVAASMSGVARTLHTRTFAAAMTPGISVSQIMNAVAQRQYTDCLHYSFIPSVLMRYVTSILNYPLLVVILAIIREMDVPMLSSVHSAVEFVGGKEITDEQDRALLRAYFEKNLANECFYRANEGFGDVREDSNISLYVFGDSSIFNNPLRCSVTSRDGLGSDVEKLKIHLINWFCAIIEESRHVFTNFGNFCSVHWQAEVTAAIDILLASDLDMSGFFGEFQTASDPRSIIQTLFASTDRFTGLLEEIPGQKKRREFLRMGFLPGGDYGFLVYAPTAIMLQTLFQTQFVDFNHLQQGTAASIVKFYLERYVPYSLLPMDQVFLDGYENVHDVVPIIAEIDRRSRPLHVPRHGYKRFFKWVWGSLDGCSNVSLYEDYAHMDSIITLAWKLGIMPRNGRIEPACNYTLLDLTKWSFDVVWGNPGDETPVVKYNVELDEDDLEFERFQAKDGRYAFVRVLEDHQLQLNVVHMDDIIHTMESTNTHREGQQGQIFRFGWGPTLRFGRPGVLFKTLDGTLWTLIPKEIPPMETLLKDWSKLVWYEHGTLTATNGVTVKHVKGGDVADSHLLFGTRLAVNIDCPEIRAVTGLVISEPKAGAGREKDFLQCYLAVNATPVPQLGKVSVVVKRLTKSAGYSKTFATHFLCVCPSHLLHVDDMTLKRCREFVLIQ